MMAYFQGQSYHYLTSSINCLWLGTLLETVRIQYEVIDENLRIMEVSVYHPKYRPWEYAQGFSQANANEVAAVIESALNVMERLKAVCLSGVKAHVKI